MFRRALIVSFLLVAFCSFAVFYCYTTVRPADLAEYALSKVERSPRVLQRQPAIQKRLGVRKDFWVPKGATRRHFSIESEGSELILIDRNGKIEATELLQRVKGQLLEGNEVHHFTACEGTYFYPANRFSAKEAEFSLLREAAPVLLGTAETVNFSFRGKTPLLNADRVDLQAPGSIRARGEHATGNALGKTVEIGPTCRLEFPSAFLKCEGPLSLHLQEQIAETALPFHYEDAEFCIDAQEGKLLYAEGKPQTIQCVGMVRLSSEENYALADELVYFPETKKLHLLAKESGRVLFWKSDGSIQISAPQVAAHLGEREEIKGIGDVHCTFDLEEEHRIESFFGKYL